MKESNEDKLKIYLIYVFQITYENKIILSYFLHIYSCVKLYFVFFIKLLSIYIFKN